MNKVSTNFFPFLVFSFLSTPFVFAQKIIPDQSVLTATLSGVKITEKAVKSITAYNVIRSGNVEYVAGEVIDLKSGFHVANGASFRARIEPVSQVNARVSSETAVEEGESKLLVTAYPNPFSNDTQIEYWLPESTAVNVAVFDEKGSEIARIIESQMQSKGKHKVTFSSEGLTAGTYLCVVNTARERKVQKIVKQ
jgi:Secretion system C-terminal sorting domain